MTRSFAFALLVVALCSCSTTKKIAPDPSRPRTPVVLVHGIFDTAIATRPMQHALEAAGYRCVAPTLTPADGRTGLEDLAAKLGESIDRELGKDAEFSVVGFSMGGIVSRYYLQELGGHRRCRGLYTVSSPHNGTLLGYFFPSKGAKQMRPNSDFLEALNTDTSALQQMDVASYRTPLDTMIIPSKSSKWNIADNVVIWSIAHPLMLSSGRLQRDIVERLEKSDGRSK